MLQFIVDLQTDAVSLRSNEQTSRGEMKMTRDQAADIIIPLIIGGWQTETRGAPTRSPTKRIIELSPPPMENES